jgi:hypothetical protein
MRAFARTIRCAIVGALVRKAAAICSVVRPQTSRSAIAACASAGSAGWQQMKMSRSRSSGKPSSIEGSVGCEAMSRCRERSSRTASSRALLRSLSMTRNRPAEISQDRESLGTPFSGHCAAAARNAS